MKKKRRKPYQITKKSHSKECTPCLVAEYWSARGGKRKINLIVVADTLTRMFTRFGPETMGYEEDLELTRKILADLKDLIEWESEVELVVAKYLGLTVSRAD